MWYTAKNFHDLVTLNQQYLSGKDVDYSKWVDPMSAGIETRSREKLNELGVFAWSAREGKTSNDTIHIHHHLVTYQRAYVSFWCPNRTKPWLLISKLRENPEVIVYTTRLHPFITNLQDNPTEPTYLIKTVRDSVERLDKRFRIEARDISKNGDFWNLDIVTAQKPWLIDVVEKSWPEGGHLDLVKVVKDAIHQSGWSQNDSHPTAVETLNIDCTILLALVSDRLHLKGDDQLLPSIIWPTMGDRKLVCSREAVEQMRRIIDILGTKNEQARSRIIMGDHKEEDQEEGHTNAKELSSFSGRQIPTNWQLPIIAVDENLTDLERFPPVEKSAEPGPNSSSAEVNPSSEITTISDVVGLIETVSGKFNEEKSPYIWLCPVAKSLEARELLLKLNSPDYSHLFLER